MGGLLVSIPMYRDYWVWYQLFGVFGKEGGYSSSTTTTPFRRYSCKAVLHLLL